MKLLNRVFFLVFLALNSCQTSDQQAVIPFVPVDIQVFTSDPLYINLNFVGGFAYVPGGSRGIVVYKVDVNNFVAFDRHCTHDISNPCGIVEFEDTFTLKDYCCGSQFLVTDGSVLSQPANFPLQQYNTSFNGEILRIFN